MATCKDCLHFNDCLSYGKTRYYGENSACNDVQERCQYFKNKENFVEVCRCKDCLYWQDKNSKGTQGICLCGEKDMNYGGEFYPFENDFCSYGTPKERGEKK